MDREAGPGEHDRLAHVVLGYAGQQPLAELLLPPPQLEAIRLDRLRIAAELLHGAKRAAVDDDAPAGKRRAAIGEGVDRDECRRHVAGGCGVVNAGEEYH
jgi:hypothetical protein